MANERWLLILLVGGLVFLWSAPGRGQQVPFSRGDVNADGDFDLSDPIFFLLASFAGGDEVPCRDAADANDDGELDLADVVYALGALFLNGPAPAPPHTSCGLDPTPDALDCASHSACEAFLPVPPFRVTIQCDRQSGFVGTVFNLQGIALGAPAGIVSHHWDLEDGMEATTERVDVSFDEAGVHVVTLTLGDALGREARGTIALTVFEGPPPPVVTSKISPQAGPPGIRVRIESPLFLEPEDLIQLQIGQSEPYTPFRSELGAVNAFIPLDAGGRDPTGFEAHEITVTILVEGFPAESFPFQLTPHAPLAGNPGELLEEVCNLLILSTEGMTEGLVGYLDLIGASEVERAVVLALMAKTRADLEDHRARVGILLSGMDPEVVALMEYAALANGLQEALAELRAAADGRGAGGDVVNAGFLNQVCAFTARANSLEDVNTATSVICPALSVISWIPGPQQPFIAVLSALCTAVDLVTGVVNDVYAEILPEMGTELLVTADPSSISPRGTSKISVELKLTPAPGFCEKEFNIQERIAETVFDRLVGSLLPGFVAELILEYSETEDTIAAAVRDYITEFTSEIVDDLGVADSLVNLQTRICAFLQNDRVQITTEALDDFSSAGGNLVRGSPDGRFWCTTGVCDSSHAIRATMHICRGTTLEQTLVGWGGVFCRFPKVAGRWSATETCSGCGEPAEVSHYIAHITQTGAQLEVTGGLLRGGEEGGGTTTIDCDGTITWQGSYKEDDFGGIVTERVMITFRGSTLEGGSTWTYRGEGGETCSGTCTVRGRYVGP